MRASATLLWLGLIALSQAPPPAAIRIHEEWLRERMTEATSIRPEMNRVDLLKVFEEDGGIHFVSGEQYRVLLQQGRMASAPVERHVLKTCRLIKVDVKFKMSSNLADAGPITDSDLVIESISKPYLEPMFMD